MNQKHYTIPVFIPELACPFQCIYCNQKNITGKQHSPGPEDIEKIISEHLSTLPESGSTIEIGFFGGNFTGIAPALQKTYLQAVQSYIKNGRISGIRLSTRPDYISEEKLHLLKKYHVSTIELGAQSLDNGVLKKAGRGHSAEDVVRASKIIKNAGFQLGLQMMIGLPGDTLTKSIRTAKAFVKLKADFVRIYPTLVIKGTRLEIMLKAGHYKALSLNEAIDWSAEISKIFEKAGIPIIRMGLHPSEGFITKTALAAGPFHPAFRELVLTKLWQDQFKPIIKQKKYSTAAITIPQNEYPYAVGHKSTNKKLLLEYFNKVDFIKCPALKGRNFNVDFS